MLRTLEDVRHVTRNNEVRSGASHALWCFGCAGNLFFHHAHVTPQVKMTDDYLEFQPKERGNGGAVGVSLLGVCVLRTSHAPSQESKFDFAV